MTKKVQLSIILTVAIIAYFLIESFYNTCLSLSWMVFSKLDELELILPWLLISIIVISIEIIILCFNIIKENCKIYCLLYIIIGLRLFTQFFISAEISMVFNLILLFSILIFFLELFFLNGKVEFLNDYQLIIGGIILGIGIQFIFLIINISSNLSTEFFKLPFTFGFAALLFYTNYLIFRPKNLDNGTIKIENQNNLTSRKQIGSLHFFLTGVLFILAITWIINPMALSSYDILNMSYNGLTPNLILQWNSYGFNYYIFVILITGTISFFLIQKIFLKTNKNFLKLTLLISNGILCALNCFALFIIEQDNTFFSTIYLTILTIISIFSILLYISYLIHHYSWPSRYKTYLGFGIFVFSVLLSIMIEYLLCWRFYFSLPLSIMIFSLMYFGFFSIVELRKFSETLRIKPHITNLNKFWGILFSIMFILILISFGFVVITRKIEPEPSGNPTLMTWNIHNAVGMDDKFDIDRIIDEIKSNNPDILGLNEIDCGSIQTSFVDITSYIAHKLNMYFYYGPTFFKHYGNAILSKYPFLEAETFPIPRVVAGSEPRAVIRARFLINSQIWTIFVTHLSTKHQDRLAQVSYNYSDSIVSIIADSTFERVVWMGDFNFDPTSEEYSMLNLSESIKFIDTHQFLATIPEYTGNFDNNYQPTRRIDYIMCSPDLIPTESEVICSIGSDHCAVLTKF